MTTTFTLASTPPVLFGPGTISQLSKRVSSFGKHVLLITGSRSFVESTISKTILDDLDSRGIKTDHVRITTEPDPSVVDNVVGRFQSSLPACVVAIGGGSALDAGKAISAMLRLGGSVKDYLEGVGTKEHPGIKVPFIAVPTTSGTGSEATKNAVISEVGESGYKRSLRHSNFIPDLAIIDPELTLSCPPSTTAASGMDAFTQLLESYLSDVSNWFTDVLALDGLRCIAQSLRKSYHNGSDVQARAGMAWAAYLSGVTLANAGLGVIHGFASSIGAHFNIPHGVICSALMAPANEVTIRKLRSQADGHEALAKYATAGRIFADHERRADDYYIDFFSDTIRNITSDLQIPALSNFGVNAVHFGKIISETGNKNNPVPLSKEELEEVLRKSCDGI